MSWFKKEAKAFGREFSRQGKILLFGSSGSKPKKSYDNSYGSARRNAEKAYKYAIDDVKRQVRRDKK